MPGETFIVFVLVLTSTITFARIIPFFCRSFSVFRLSLIEAEPFAPFLTVNVFLPSLSSGLVARSSSTEPAQPIGESSGR